MRFLLRARSVQAVPVSWGDTAALPRCFPLAQRTSRRSNGTRRMGRNSIRGEDSLVLEFVGEVFRDVSRTLRSEMSADASRRKAALAFFLARKARAEYLSGKCSDGGK